MGVAITIERCRAEYLLVEVDDDDFITPKNDDIGKDDDPVKEPKNDDVGKNGDVVRVPNNDDEIRKQEIEQLKRDNICDIKPCCCDSCYPCDYEVIAKLRKIAEERKAPENRQNSTLSGSKSCPIACPNCCDDDACGAEEQKYCYECCPAPNKKQETPGALDSWCKGRPTIGDCDMLISGFTFDPVSKTCESFKDRGCAETKNLYRTLEECETTCNSKPKQEGDKCASDSECGEGLECKSQFPFGINFKFPNLTCVKKEGKCKKHQEFCGCLTTYPPICHGDCCGTLTCEHYGLVGGAGTCVNKEEATPRECCKKAGVPEFCLGLCSPADAMARQGKRINACSKYDSIIEGCFQAFEPSVQETSDESDEDGPTISHGSPTIVQPQGKQEDPRGIEIQKQECSGDLVYGDCHSHCEPRQFCGTDHNGGCIKVCRKGCGCPRGLIRSFRNSTTCINKSECKVDKTDMPTPTPKTKAGKRDAKGKGKQIAKSQSRDYSCGMGPPCNEGLICCPDETCQPFC